MWTLSKLLREVYGLSIKRNGTGKNQVISCTNFIPWSLTILTILKGGRGESGFLSPRLNCDSITESILLLANIPYEVVLLHRLEHFWEEGAAMLGNLGKIMTSRQNLFNRQNWGWVSGGVAEGGCE